METSQDRVEVVDLDKASGDYAEDEKNKSEDPHDQEEVGQTKGLEDKKGQNEQSPDYITEESEEATEQGQTQETKDDLSDGWEDIIGSGDLKRKVVKEGAGVDTRPERGQVVTLRTEGHLDNGTLIDINKKAKFSLGEGDMLQAWEICIPLMELGEVCTLITTSRFAYGEMGRNPDIPANATITYEIELIHVEDAVDLTTIPIDERCKMADNKRERGNELFTRNNYSGAINSYTRALAILDADETADEDGFKQIQQSKIKCYNNLAAAQIKVKAYGAALKSCDWVLSNEKENAKALFRKGKVLAAQGELAEALTVTKKALKLEPSNKTIHQELSRLLAKQSEQKEEEKLLYKKMVGDMANMAENTTQQKPKMKNKYAFLALLTGLLAVITAVLIQTTSE